MLWPPERQGRACEVRGLGLSRILFVTHPEVVIDPTVPVPRWPLSARGLERMEALAAKLVGRGVTGVWSSDEQKAIDGAQVLSRVLAVLAQVDPRLGENDRSATGYIAPPEFWTVVQAFFACPDRSVRGWETANSAQARIVAATDRIAAYASPGLTVVVSHGGVGRLLLAHLLGVAIGDDPRPGNPAGGCYFEFDPVRRSVEVPT